MSGDSLTQDELLIHLTEECGEVIQATTKCLRFGFEREYDIYGRNDLALARECGELTAIIDTLPLDRDALNASYRNEIARALAARREAGR